MKRFINPDPGTWEALSSRQTPSDAGIAESVKDIVEKVRNGGDRAIREITEGIDGSCPETFEVSEAEFDYADAQVPQQMKEALGEAAGNIRAFHNAQVFKPLEVKCQDGVKCWQKSVPIDSIGLYIPGGSAPLFSTVLMLAIPAKIAGCSKMAMCTPCNKEGKVNSTVLYAAKMCGIDKIYKIGGAQAIAAMAYGTETIGKADKIFGPGNRYVVKAKQLVSKDVAIDMPAGPSEVLVIADANANPEFVAADLLSQAEHGQDSQVILVCFSESFADRTMESVGRQLGSLPRKDIAKGSLENSRTLVFDTIGQAVDFTNCYAPEHLIIQTERPWEIADKIKAAGSVFIGAYSPESAGDYASGTNHTLPTSGWAKSFSGVNLDAFSRKMTYQELTRDGLLNLAGTIVTMAEGEGLAAHANAVKIRIEKKED